MLNGKVIIVEDDAMLNKALCRTFANAGYEAMGAASVREARSYMKEDTALMVIDVGLPDGDGFLLCRQAHEKYNIPVIFLTARDDESDMHRGFDCGADDYLVKPFPMSVLLRHAQAVLRRTREEEKEIFIYKDLSIDFERRQVTGQGKVLNLTPKEYGLLELLVQNRKKVVTKQMILEQLWDVQGAFVEENTVNVTLSRLRKKIEPDPANPIYIKNVFGIGYTFGG